MTTAQKRRIEESAALLQKIDENFNREILSALENKQIRSACNITSAYHIFISTLMLKKELNK